MRRKLRSLGDFVRRSVLVALAFAVFGLALQVKLAAYDTSSVSGQASAKLSVEKRTALVLEELGIRDWIRSNRDLTYLKSIRQAQAIRPLPYSVAQEAEIDGARNPAPDLHYTFTLRRPPPSLI